MSLHPSLYQRTPKITLKHSSLGVHVVCSKEIRWDLKLETDERWKKQKIYTAPGLKKNLEVKVGIERKWSDKEVRQMDR